MIKIAYIINSLETPSAGTEKQLLLLINEMDKSKFKPYLICLRDSEWLQNNDLPFDVHILHVRSLFSLSFLRGIYKFRKLHKIYRFNIAQTYFTEDNIFGTIAARISGIKFILSSRRNHGGKHWHNKKWLFILRRLRRWTTLYISNSKSVAEYTINAEKIDPNNIVVIYNGIKPNKYKIISSELRQTTRQKLSIKDTEILIGLIANWRPVKNIPLYLQVAYKLQKCYPQCKFIMVGSPPTESILNDVLMKYNISNVVSFLGSQKNTVPYLAAMDIGALCSKSESLSNSIIEYMAAGIPCVVSNAGGNSEVICNGNYGLLFDNNNADDFFDKLEALINNKDLRAKLAKSGKEYAQNNYHYIKSIKAHEELYTKLAEDKK